MYGLCQATFWDVYSYKPVSTLCDRQRHQRRGPPGEEFTGLLVTLEVIQPPVRPREHCCGIPTVTEQFQGCSGGIGRTVC